MSGKTNEIALYIMIKQRCRAWSGMKSYLANNWASLIPQLVKNPPAMQKTWV